MDGRAYLKKYVSKRGLPASATALSIPYPTLAAICNGTRGISKGMAKRLAENSGGELDANKLVWVEQLADRAA